jgi:hypothetical protein
MIVTSGLPSKAANTSIICPTIVCRLTFKNYADYTTHQPEKDLE